MGGMSAITGPLELVSAPQGRIVSLKEAKTNSKIEDDSEDGLVSDLILQAQEYLEGLIEGQRQLMPAVYDLPLACFPPDVFPLPRPPLLGVLSVSYRDLNDTLTTPSASLYNVRTPWKQPGSIERSPYQIWPVVFADRPYPVTVRFMAGYGAAFTADATTNVLTLSGRHLENEAVIRLVSTTTLPGGLDQYTDYYVRDSSAATFKVATTLGGSAVDITDAGTGTHFVAMPPVQAKRAVLLLVGHWFLNREASLKGTISKEVEFSVSSLAQQLSWGSYA